MKNNQEYFLIIEGKNRVKQYLIDLFISWELLLFFVWRDTLVRYKQAFFGIAWALIRPILNMVLFTFFFGKIANLPSDNINYPIFVLAGMLPWQLFSNSISETCPCLINNTNLISKVFFPRMILPLSQIAVQLVDFFINFILFILLALFYSSLSIHFLITLPVFIVMNLMLCVGIGFWFSALTARYRDVRFIVPFIVQFGMFVSPVGYGSFVINGPWKSLYYLNPMVGIIDGFRYAFFGIAHPDFYLSILLSFVTTSVIFFSGFLYFRSEEMTFADRI